MLYISKWKATAILLTAFVVCLFAVPNFFPESTVKRWPEWAQRHIVLGLEQDTQQRACMASRPDKDAGRGHHSTSSNVIK